AATKQELGERVAEVTQLTSQLADTENSRHSLEDKLHTLTEETQRREELLQNDLAGKSKELSDTLRKLTTVTQEKQRQAEALTRDANAKAEQLKALEARMQQQAADAKKLSDTFQQQIASLTGDLDGARKEIAARDEQLRQAGNAQA